MRVQRRVCITMDVHVQTHPLSPLRDCCCQGKMRAVAAVQKKNSALPCETRTNARQMGTRHMSAQTLLQVAHLAVWRVALSWVRLFVFRHATQPVIHLHTTRRQQPTIDTHRPPKQPSYSMAAG